MELGLGLGLGLLRMGLGIRLGLGLGLGFRLGLLDSLLGMATLPLLVRSVDIFRRYRRALRPGSISRIKEPTSPCRYTRPIAIAKRSNEISRLRRREPLHSTLQTLPDHSYPTDPPTLFRAIRKARPEAAPFSISTLYFQNSKFGVFNRQNSKLYFPSLYKHLTPIVRFLPIDKISSVSARNAFQAGSQPYRGASKTLSMSRVAPTYAATATNAPLDTSATGSSVPRSTTSK